MELTFTGTLIELSKISDINERLLRFLNECARDEKYKNIDHIRHILHDVSMEGALPIGVKSKMWLLYPDAVKNTLERIKKLAPGDSRIFFGAEEIEMDLRALDYEMNELNKDKK